MKDLRAWVAIGIALLALGCSQRTADQQLNVLILSLDTTRWDRFGTTGYAPARTPRFDAWSRERAVQFDQAMSAIPLTLPSHTSIMSGTYPVFHGIHDNDGYYLDDEVTTLAEMLGDAGFDTAAFVAAFPLDSQFNLDQGFDVYDDDFEQDWSLVEQQARTAMAFGFTERTARQVNLAVERWFDQRQSDAPFFLWAHYFDPHQGYEPPAPYDTQFSDSPYDGEIAFVDEQFGKLLTMLEENGVLESTVIVVVGDHGEALGQHGEPTHASYVYDATLRVPLWISVPGDRFPAGTRVPAQVRTIDVAPTILALLDQPMGADMQGTSLVPLLEQPDLAWSEDALLESSFTLFQFGWGPLRALRSNGWKYIQGPKPELYHLRDDPQELHNLVGQQPQKAAELEAQLIRLVRRMSSSDLARSTNVQVDPEARKKLEALGYLGGGASASLRSAPFPDPTALAAMPNPIDHALTLSYVNSAENLMRVRRYNDALPVIRQGLVLDPTNYRLHNALGRGLGALGIYDEALAVLGRAVALQPENAESYMLMGFVNVLQGDREQAVVHLTEAVTRAPQNAGILQSLAASYGELERWPEALEHWQLVTSLDESNWSAYREVGKLQARLGAYEEAREAFQQALTLNPYSPSLLYDIGVLYQHLQELAFSRRMFESVLRVSPDHVGGHVKLAEVLLATGEEDARNEAVRLLGRVATLAPGSTWAEQARAMLDGA